MSNLSNISQSIINNFKFHNFPCGNGSWNISDDYNENPALFKIDDLIDLLKDRLSPWVEEEILQNEIMEIKKSLIINKEVPSIKALFKKFKILKLVDKNIHEVGNDISLFLNLEELTLSANFIKSIDSKILPKNLKVLELYANELESLEFCQNKDMPHLQHLGVGGNLISNIDMLSASMLKKSVVSLDLSKNKLSNLSKTAVIISEISNLKNLILSGNPLSLFAAYRAYIIDSIKTLIVLDDFPITADERFSVRNMAKISEPMKNLCKFKIEILSIGNIPFKEKPENSPEEPVIKTDYYAKFWFPFQYQNNASAENTEELTNDNKIEDEIMHLHTSAKLPRINPDIPLNMSEDIEIKNITRFCEFLNERIKIEIIEENKYLYSPENLPVKAPSRMDSQSSKRRQPTKSANKHTSNNPPKAKETGKKKKIDESKLIMFSKFSQKLAEYKIDLINFKNGEIFFDQILKYEIKTNSKNNENLKIPQEKESKNKKISAKGDQKKLIDKNNTLKDGKSPSTQMEQPIPIECHVVLKLLTITNTTGIY